MERGALANFGVNSNFSAVFLRNHRLGRTPRQESHVLSAFMENYSSLKEWPRSLASEMWDRKALNPQALYQGAASSRAKTRPSTFRKTAHAAKPR